MNNSRNAPLATNLLANAIGRVLLGVTLIVLGATNCFLNLFSFGRDIWPLINGSPLPTPNDNAGLTVATWAILVILFSVIPFLLGVRLVMLPSKAARASTPTVTTEEKSHDPT